MDQITLINKNVNIVAYYFKSGARRLRCFPKRMEYDGRRIEFTETSTIHSADKIEGKVEIFDMTDGSRDYRLEFNPATLNWKLIAINDHYYGPVFTQFAAAA